MRGAALALLALAACAGDETVSRFADGAATYRLSEIDGASFPARATIRFAEAGRVSGTGPCNSFTAPQIVPYPWIEIGPIAATRRACPALEAERRYFAALREMTLAEVAEGTLILSTPEGREMVFQAD